MSDIKVPTFDTGRTDALCAVESGELPDIQKTTDQYNIRENDGALVIRPLSELMNVEQPVNLEELFHELNMLAWSLEDECRQVNEVISMMQEKIAAKEEEYAPKMGELEEKIKAEILKQQKAFKCDWGAATYRKAYDRTSWDSKKLEGLALVLPQIKECKSVSRVEAGVTLKVGYNL